MFFGVTHVDVPVTDIARAEAFWGKLIGLKEVKRGEGFLDLDSGSVILRLVQVPSVSRPVTLRVHVGNVEAAYDTLVKSGGRALYESQRTPALEVEAHVADPDGNAAIVWRELSEDEYGFTPELPKQGEWQPEAEELLNRLLGFVPALFRGMARRKVTKVIAVDRRLGQSRGQPRARDPRLHHGQRQDQARPSDRAAEAVRHQSRRLQGRVRLLIRTHKACAGLPQACHGYALNPALSGNAPGISPR